MAPPALATNLRRYWNAVQTRWWLVVVAVIAAGGLATAYARTATKIYTAEAQLLVTPVRGSDQALLGLGLITSSIDPTRPAQTVAALVRTAALAQAVRSALGLRQSATSLLGTVTAAPAGSSDVVKVSATSASPQKAMRLTNAFAGELVALRTARMHQLIALELPGLLAGIRSASPTDPLVQEVAELQILRSAPDPTLQVVAPAQLPPSPTSPRPLLSLIIGCLGGFVVGLAGALALYMADPRLRRTETLLERYRIPVLARLPRLGRGTRGRFIDQAAQASHLRVLVARLLTTEPERSRRVVVLSGVSGGEGTTTSSLQLAAALVRAGQEVVVVHPDLQARVDGLPTRVPPERSLQAVLAGSLPPEEALVEWAPGISLLLPAADAALEARDLLGPQEVPPLLRELGEIADWVVVDSRSAAKSIDLLPFAEHASHLLLVVRRGQTLLPDLAQLSALLVQSKAKPDGFLVIG